MRWLARKEIVHKTVGIGLLQALSKLFGFFRELAFARFLGVGVLADAFFTSWRVPSLLRRFLAEGALNAAAVPQLLHTYQRDGKAGVGRCMSALLIIVQLILLLLLAGIWYHPYGVLWLLVPGWQSGEERLVYAAYAIRWTMLVIIPFSASALLAGALQAMHHFFVPAASQFVFNVLLVSHIAVGIAYQWHMAWLLVGIVGYSFVTLGMHGWMYWTHGFRWHMPDRLAWKRAGHVMRALASCCITYGAFEVNMLADHILVSYLAVGSQALLYYVSAFIQMPLSIAVAAFSTVLLPHFSAIRTRVRRQQFYLLEAIKVAIWMLVPVMIVIMIFARSIFATTILAHSTDVHFVYQAAWLLTCGACGLVAFAINRICMSVFYSVEMPGYAGMITLIGTALNVLLSGVSMLWIGLYGVVGATVIAAWCKTGGYLYGLYVYARIPTPLTHIWDFTKRYICHLAVTGWGLYVAYHMLHALVSWLCAGWVDTLISGIGMWLWIAPLCIAWMYTLYATRKAFGVRLHFLRSLTNRE